MSKFSFSLLAAAIMSFAAVTAEPAFAGNRGECVEGGYGLGWKGGRPYYYTPFGVKGSFDCFTRTGLTQTTGKRVRYRNNAER
jgi:hypothetical protein